MEDRVMMEQRARTRAGEGVEIERSVERDNEDAREYGNDEDDVEGLRG